MTKILTFFRIFWCFVQIFSRQKIKVVHFYSCMNKGLIKHPRFTIYEVHRHYAVCRAACRQRGNTWNRQLPDTDSACKWAPWSPQRNTNDGAEVVTEMWGGVGSDLWIYAELGFQKMLEQFLFRSSLWWYWSDMFAISTVNWILILKHREPHFWLESLTKANRYCCIFQM